MLQASCGGASLTAITCVFILCVISVYYSIVTIATNEYSNINGDWRDSLPWLFLLLCKSNSIIRSSLSQFI